MSMKDITQDELTCRHQNSISVYDTTCHVILGKWYCVDCKTVWKTRVTDGISKENES